MLRTLGGFVGEWLIERCYEISSVNNMWPWSLLVKRVCSNQNDQMTKHECSNFRMEYGVFELFKCIDDCMFDETNLLLSKQWNPLSTPSILPTLEGNKALHESTQPVAFRGWSASKVQCSQAISFTLLWYHAFGLRWTTSRWTMNLDWESEGVNGANATKGMFSFQCQSCKLRKESKEWIMNHV